MTATEPLVTHSNLEAPDDFYEALIDAHRDLRTDQSHALNARLVLLLANHIGRLDVLRQALAAARAATEDPAAARTATEDHAAPETSA